MHSVNRIQDETPQGNGREARIAAAEPTIGDLVKQLGQDLETLVRQQVALGKAEIGQIGKRAAKDGASFAIAALVGLMGLMTVMAGLVILVGQALDDRYWLSALILGAVALVVAWVLVNRARSDLKHNPLVPKETIATIREDKQWASREARELKQDLTTNNPASPARRVTRP
jgi:hypothetical protein